MSDTINLSIQLGKENLHFHLKMIDLAEEAKMRERTYGLTEAEIAEKSFDLNVAALAGYEAEKIDVITFGENGEQIKTPVDTKEYFAEKTIIKSRIAEYAIRGFLVAQTPNVDFL